MTRRARSTRASLAIASLAAVLAACGSDDTGSPTSTPVAASESTSAPATTAATSTDATTTAAVTPTATVYPVTIDNCGEQVTYDAAPEKVITADTSMAETLVALGVSDRIVATYFDFANSGIEPANRQVLDTLNVIGADGYPSREQVVALDPDFVYAFGESDFDREGSPTRDDLAAAGAAIYVAEAYGCGDDTGTVTSSFGEILDLGIIFDRQTEAEAIVAGFQMRLDAVAAKVSDAPKPQAIFWDAYDFENVRLLPFGGYQDAITQAGGEVLFSDVTDASPVSKEQIATSDVSVVFALDYGADTTTPLLPDMTDLIANTPAGASGGLGVVPVTNYPVFLHGVDLVEEIAKALHPDLFP